MDNELFFVPVSEETIASWLDRTMDPEEECRFEEYLDNPVVAAILDANDAISWDIDTINEDEIFLPEIFLSDFSIPSLNDEAEEMHLFDDGVDLQLEDTFDDAIGGKGNYTEYLLADNYEEGYLQDDTDFLSSVGGDEGEEAGEGFGGGDVFVY